MQTLSPNQLNEILSHVGTASIANPRIQHSTDYNGNPIVQVIDDFGLVTSIPEPIFLSIVSKISK